MEGRGKKSVAALQTVKVNAIERPEPPEELTPEQAHEWEMIVNRMPADWFPRETHGLLLSYCQHLSNAKFSQKVIEKLKASAKTLDELMEITPEVEKWTRIHDREVNGHSRLATRMRISQQAQYSHKKATGKGTSKKPWD